MKRLARRPSVNPSTSALRASSTFRSPRLLVAFLALVALPSFAMSQTQNPQDAAQLARDVFYNEVQAQLHDQSLWKFREIKEEDGKQKLLAVCQTRRGDLERLLALNGQPLTARQQASEDLRLRKLAANSELLRQKQKKQREDAEQARNLMKIFPYAFTFQFDGSHGAFTKLKFSPNPKFRPANRAALVFSRMEGSLLLDPRQKRLAEIDGRLTSEIKFGGGILGHLDKGGTFVVKQEDLGGQWEMTFLDVRMNGKAVFFKTIAVRQKEVYSKFAPLPPDITAQQAADILQKESSTKPL